MVFAWKIRLWQHVVFWMECHLWLLILFACYFKSLSRYLPWHTPFSHLNGSTIAMPPLVHVVMQVAAGPWTRPADYGVSVMLWHVCGWRKKKKSVDTANLNLLIANGFARVLRAKDVETMAVFLNMICKTQCSAMFESDLSVAADLHSIHIYKRWIHILTVSQRLNARSSNLCCCLFVIVFLQIRYFAILMTYWPGLSDLKGGTILL